VSNISPTVTKQPAIVSFQQAQLGRSHFPTQCNPFDGGNITIEGIGDDLPDSIDTSLGVLGAASPEGNGGDIRLEAEGDITTASVSTSSLAGGRNPGNIVQSGAESVLASLWRVSDGGTMALTMEFYRQLQDAPIKAEALRRAQVTLLNEEVGFSSLFYEGNEVYEGNEDTLLVRDEFSELENWQLEHPYYWAAFTMVGSPW
jgi:hypothetical protein